MSTGHRLSRPWGPLAAAGSSALTALTATVLAATVLAATAAAPAGAQSSNPLIGAARLQGTYQLSGRLTIAAHVLGERVGQAVTRNWSFSSSCAAGPCSTVSLTRQRAGGTDTVVLQQRSSGYYVGSGSFYAPLQCATTTYPAGELVPFTIAVNITDATVQNGTAVATSIAAAYNNPYRVNLTPCVGVLGRDGALYQGGLIGPARDVKAKRRRRG